MSTDDYQVQNTYRYARKSYKKNLRREDGGCNPCDDANVESDCSPRSDAVAVDVPSCSYDMEHDGEVASLLHKKCPVITLAQQQLKRLLDDTDRILCENTRCCRSMYDFLCICREVFLSQNRCLCALFFLMTIAFLAGFLFGAASCGTYLRQFDSPILTCIENLFISEPLTSVDVFHGIA